ncbi:hypothetical protein AAVH_05720 [Aphelenchoides avenae]|nr:hypothetical protein AAVH_05720 [Aphelenchus avenae]
MEARNKWKTISEGGKNGLESEFNACLLRKIDAISQASISESRDANEAAILHDKLRQAVGPLLEALRSGRVITSVARNPDGFPLENGNGDDAQSTIFEDKLRQAVGPLIEALRAARI